MCTAQLIHVGMCFSGWGNVFKKNVHVNTFILAKRIFNIILICRELQATLVQFSSMLCIFTGLCEKVPSKFSEESSVKADGLCIGCLSQWAEVGRENSNMQEFFCTTL